MGFSELSPAERSASLGQSVEAENAIAAYQTREGIPSTIDTPPSTRTELASSTRSRALERIVYDTQRRNFTTGLARATPSELQYLDLYLQQVKAPDYVQRSFSRELNARGITLEDLRLQPPPPPPPTPPTIPSVPDPDISTRSSELQRIVQDTQRRNFSTGLARATPSELGQLDRYLQEVTTPDYIQRSFSRELNARGVTLENLRLQTAANPNPNPPQTPPTTTDRKPPPTSLDNAPSLRTAQTSGARAPTTATAPPRPAQPSHWNLYQPIGATPPPATRAIPRPMDQPPPGLPQAAARGRLGYGAAGAGLDLGLRLAHGQDIGQAAYGAAGGLAGGLAGQGLGQSIGAGLGLALGGPPGAAVGGMLGGFVGQFGGGYAGGSLADRYYPGNNAPLPGAPIPGEIEELPLPRPIAASPWIPGPAIPFDPTRPRDRRPRLGNIPDPSDPIRDVGPYSVEWNFQAGGSAQRENPNQEPAGLTVHGPVSISQRYDAGLYSWFVVVTHFGTVQNGRQNTPVIEPVQYGGWPEKPPQNFTSRNLALPNSPTQPFNPSNAWPPTPENAPRPNPNNSPNNQYHPNPLPQAAPSPSGQPTGEPLPGNLGGNEPQLQPQRSPDGTPQPAPVDRAYPPGAGSPGAGNSGTSGFPTTPVAAGLAAAAALPAIIRARIQFNAQRPTPTPLPRGSGSATPPPPPATPEEPCRGNRCSQRQLRGIDDANTRLLRLEQGLLGGADLAANAAILRKLNEIDAKLGPQITGGGIGNFIKKMWDSMVVQKILNILTFVTVLHNAYMLSSNLSQTLFSAFDNILEFFGAEFKDANGQDVSTSQWASNAIEGFFNGIFGTETVNGIQSNWKKFNRIYQAASNIISSFQSMIFSVLESLEVVGNYVALIGNASKKFGVFTEKCYRWMNPNLNFTTNKYFNALNNVQEAVESIDEVTGEALNIQQTGAELFNQQAALKTAVEEVIPGDQAGKNSSSTDTPQHLPSTTFESKLISESQKVLLPIPDTAEVRQD